MLRVMVLLIVRFWRLVIFMVIMVPGLLLSALLYRRTLSRRMFILIMFLFMFELLRMLRRSLLVSTVVCSLISVLFWG